MANKIQLKRGANAPAAGILDVGEPGFDTTNKKFYIGDSEGNPILINEDPEVYASDTAAEVMRETFDADTLGGHPASDFRMATWLPTPSQIGAASKGYGLGTEAPQYIDDLNTCLSNGWYAFSDGCANRPENLTHGSLFVLKRDSSRVTQMLFGINYTGNPQMIRYTTDAGATWIEEWVNPRMLLNTEYRTTERWNGKEVYAKLISYNPGAQIGATGTLTEINIPHGISNFGGGLIRWHGRIDQNGYVLPYLTSNGGMTTVTAAGVNSIVLRIYNMTWAAGYTFYITLYYVKN